MNSKLSLEAHPSAIKGVAVSRDLRRFGRLVEDLQTELGEAWADLSLADALIFLGTADATMPEFVAITVSEADDAHLDDFAAVIRLATERDVRVLVVADTISTDALAALLSSGATDVIPYPPDDGVLAAAISAVDQHGPTPRRALAGPAPDPRPNMRGPAAVFAVQGLAGGTGASTLAANMAWELATIDMPSRPSVCLIDMNLQHATMSACLDLPRRDMMVETLQDAQRLDIDGFKQALLAYDGMLSVLPAPADMVPLDVIGPAEVDAILSLAARCFDVIVIDMPQTLTAWTDTVLTRADVYFATLELDMRSAQTALRFQRALKSEGLPTDKLNFVLNRAPGLSDLTGRTRVKRLAEALGANITTLLPDGGRIVAQAADNGEPLAKLAAKNALRREIRRLSHGLHKAMLNDHAIAS